MTAVLFTHMQPPRDRADGFFDWHRRDHVPDRLTVPGVTAGHVYRKVAAPPAQAVVYELDGLDALDSVEYRALRQRTADDAGPRLAALSEFVRVAGTLLAEGGEDGADTDAGALLALWFDVPDDDLPAFDEWYVEEHGPLLLEVATWRRWRLFDASRSNGRVSRLVLHDLDAPGATEQLDRDRRWQTARFRELRRHAWFRDVESYEYVRQP